MNAFWQASLADTVQSSRAFASGPAPTMNVEQWLLQYEEAAPTSSNQGSGGVAFQRWFHFKEAFSPKFVADTLSSLPYPVEKCLDPFGGSGTTALTSRMLGLSSATVEVNPFLADLIEAKLTPISPASFRADYERIVAKLSIEDQDRNAPAGMPPTLLEPGLNGRYVFARDVFAAARAIVRAAGQLKPEHGRLLRVLLGSVLVANSNVTINGKGRRYRRGWENRVRTANHLIAGLDAAVDRGIEDLAQFAGLPAGSHTVYRGDARTALRGIDRADVAIFSPPYPNSFDYTDVYNLELWMLGYLQTATDNRSLREDTLRSHVQLKWKPRPRIAQSSVLDETLAKLAQRRGDLWNANIPEMIEYYFDDLRQIFVELARILPTGRHAVVAVGDSQYAGVRVDVAAILSQCIEPLGFHLSERGTIRSMRTSSQHGGEFDLSEHCLVFERAR
jgi:DNA modification methylase